MGSGYYYSCLKKSVPAFPNQYSMDFDGVNDYIDCGTSIGDSLGDNYTGDLSVSFWFKTNIVTPTNDGIFSIGLFDGAAVGMFTISIYNNGLYYRLNNGVWIRTVAFTDTTSWHHLLVVYKAGSEADSKMFLDGTAVGTTSGTFPTTLNMDFAGLKTTIGAYYSEAFAMNGNIDEVAIFNTDQTANAADIYNLGVPTDLTSLNPLAWYRMGDNGVFRDPQWLLPSNENKDNYSNYSLDFDGVNDSILFITPKDIGETQQISYSVWVNLDSVTNRQYIAGNWLSSNGGTGLALETIGGNALVFQIGDGTNDSFFNSRVSNFSTLVAPNTWAHILATWDGTDAKIYINGVLRNTWTPAGGYTISGYSTTGFKIGWVGNFTNLTNGKLDELGLFNSGVSIGDVWDGSGKPIDISTVSGITHNWRLGEDATFDGTNWTLPDIVGSKPGTTTNMDISDRVGDAPGSENNAISVNMDIADKVEEVPS